MSKFGNKLDALITQNGGNKYRLSQEIGVDRVTLYRFINGERIPSKDFVGKICSALRVSPAEEKELRHLYDIAKIGESVHERRLLVKELVNQINSLRMEQMPVLVHKSVVVDGIEDAVKTVSGNYNVNVLVRGVLDDLAYNTRPKRLWTNAPFEYSFLFDHLRQLYFEMNGTIEIEHAIAFARNAHSHANPYINLETLADVLPFVFCAGIGYRPAYYYSDSMDYASVFMPFCLFTEKSLLMLSSDFKTAMLINDVYTVRAFREWFDKLQARPMFRYIDSFDGLLKEYQDILARNKNPEAAGIEAQPCTTCYFTADMAETYLGKELENRDIIKKALIQHIHNCNAVNVNSFFTEGGLADFAGGGYIMYTAQWSTLPFSLDDRLSILKSFRADVAADKNHSRMVNPAEICVSPNTTVQLYTGSAVLFSIMNESGMRMCHIDEPSIYDAFSDFLLNLHTTEWVYSKQETLEVLDRYIGEIEKAIDK